jgi:hypothetical protein
MSENLRIEDNKFNGYPIALRDEGNKGQEISTKEQH